MKRFLAYLFLVLGLGLVFSVNAYSVIMDLSLKSTIYCINKKGDHGNWPFYTEVRWWNKKCPKIMKKVSKSVFTKFKKKIDDKYVPKTIASQSTKNKNIEIAKQEPSQTQQVAESTLPECKGSKPSKWTNCKGTYTWPNGIKYVGEWKDNLRHGKGTMTLLDGEKYVGEYKTGLPNGQGTYTRFDGSTYVGEFKDQSYHGQGTLTFVDGSTYVGEWKDNERHGHGTSTWADGKKYVGEWKDNYYNGQGTLTKADGTIDNGIWNKWELVERNKIQTQIAKKEPSQTQEVAEKEKKKKYISNVIYCYSSYNKTVSAFLSSTASSYQSGGCHPSDKQISYKLFKKSIKSKSFCYRYKGSPALSWNTNSCNRPNSNWASLKHDDKNLYYSLEQTQIAKTEPSQTQEVDQLHSHLIKPDTWVYFVRLTKKEFLNVSKFDASNFLNNTKNMNNYKFDTTDNLFKYQRNIGGSLRTDIRISKKLHDTLFYKSSSILIGEGGMGKIDMSKEKKNYLKLIFNKIEDYKPKILKDLIDEYTEDNELKEGLLAYFDDEKPTIKPEDKPTEVVENTGEIYEPETGDIDNDPPVIKIAEAITFNDSDYEFEGKVTDKSKQIFIEVDGRLVDVKNGKFTVKGYSPVNKEISIEAIDGYGNRSKPKIVKIIIDIKDTDIAEKLEPLNPSKIRAKVSKNKVALIIGIENYTEAPKANYANLDAKYFFDYARKAFGVKKQNINLLINEDATFVKTNVALTKWLRIKIKPDQTDLIIFFAGHGLASSDGKELYLLPQDSDPDLLAITALSRTKLFQTIVDLKPKSVTMFLDTCYSGVSRDEQMLLASARPIRIVADEQEGIPDNFTIFSATELDQISSGLKEAKHGIFSYYLMKGLEGKADSNKDYKITNGELLAYMDLNVSQKALELGREQNPSLVGDPDQVLMSYR